VRLADFHRRDAENAEKTQSFLRVLRVSAVKATFLGRTHPKTAMKNQNSSHKKCCKSSGLQKHRELFFRADGFSAC